MGYECDQSQFAYHDNDFKAERVFWLIDWLMNTCIFKL